MQRKSFPPGWGEERVKKVIEHYEVQSEDEAVVEDEAATVARHAPSRRPRRVIARPLPKSPSSLA